jgi:hypothetical protein
LGSTYLIAYNYDSFFSLPTWLASRKEEQIENQMTCYMMVSEDNDTIGIVRVEAKKGFDY